LPSAIGPRPGDFTNAKRPEPTFEEIPECAFEMLQRVLLRMHRAILQPRRLRAIAPLREALCHADIGDELLPCCVILFLQRQRPVVDEPARARELAHLARLLASRARVRI
jgi:hypothetical protein